MVIKLIVTRHIEKPKKDPIKLKIERVLSHPKKKRAVKKTTVKKEKPVAKRVVKKRTKKIPEANTEKKEEIENIENVFPAIAMPVESEIEAKIEEAIIENNIDIENKKSE